jgi:tetratricopeptide (TPR) repeat protein
LAKIFLSYARQDAARAQRAARALESAGHEVWWDRNIGAGSRFSAEIDTALLGADMVVVLWSTTSILSAWVQDEAAAGRDSGRLIPVLIDAVEPPLGFRQYQSLDLSGARRGDKGFAPLVEAVAARGGVTAPNRPEPPPRRPVMTAPFKPLLIALCALLVIGAGWWISRGGGPEDSISIRVAAGDRDPRSADLARSIALDLSQYRAGPLGSLAILDPSDTGAADYAVDVTASADSSGLRADIAMRSSEAKGLLWSTTIEGEGRKMVDIRQQAAANLGDVLNCLVEVRQAKHQPSHEVLGLFLAGCAADIDSEQAISVFRQITAKAPDFAPAWAGLAFLESDTLGGLDPADEESTKRSASQHLALARRLDPSLPGGFAAEANLLPVDREAPSKYLAVLDRGIAANPDSALLHGLKSRALQSVGRMSDGVTEAEQAVELSPTTIGIRQALIGALAVAGRTKEAYDLLDKADRTWPGSESFAYTRYSLDVRFGDPAAALQYIRNRGTGSAAGSPMYEAWVDFLEARMDPSPAKIDRALDAFRAQSAVQVLPITGYIQALATFGRADDAYAILANPEPLLKLRMGSEILFRPHMKPVRDDPRFMMLSKQLGLVDYWQSSGHWPDFCFDPRLPYNCKAEAAKLARRSAPLG